MSDRSELISRLHQDVKLRAAYIRSKLNLLIPSQLRGLRLKGKSTQKQLADEAEMKQPRISAMERPGEVKFSLETLIRMAAAHKVGLQVKFVPFSEMLHWENNYRQDEYAVTRLEDDEAFIDPSLDMRVFFDTSPQESNVAASQREPEFNSGNTERKPMGTANEELGMAAAGSGGR